MSVNPKSSKQKEENWNLLILYSPLKLGCRGGNTRPGNFYILLDPRISVYIDWFHLRFSNRIPSKNQEFHEKKMENLWEFLWKPRVFLPFLEVPINWSNMARIWSVALIFRQFFHNFSKQFTRFSCFFSGKIRKT